MKKAFWDRTAKIYDRFMKKDHKAYKQSSYEKFVVAAKEGASCYVECSTKTHRYELFWFSNVFCLTIEIPWK